MDQITYHYDAGSGLSQAMHVQATMLMQQADDLLQRGQALVAEHLKGQGGDAYLASLTQLCKAVTNVGETIARHSTAVNNSFSSAAATDGACGQILSI